MGTGFPIRLGPEDGPRSWQALSDRVCEGVERASRPDGACPEPRRRGEALALSYVEGPCTKLSRLSAVTHGRPRPLHGRNPGGTPGPRKRRRLPTGSDLTSVYIAGRSPGNRTERQAALKARLIPGRGKAPDNTAAQEKGGKKNRKESRADGDGTTGATEESCVGTGFPSRPDGAKHLP